ncbi:MAG TPA: hypothetical protein VF980_20000 [Thermoanaerobaculia bacterium]
MKFKNVITAAAIALLPLAAGASTLIVPVAGSAPGANGSVWKSELTLHNTGGQAIVAALRYHDQNGAAESANVTVPPRGTLGLADVVRTIFARENTIGAIEIQVADADANHLAVASRTFNTAGSTEFGQDIPAVRATEATIANDVVVISGPESAANFRFNIGTYSITASSVRWELVRADGTLAATQTIEYAAGVQDQYSVPALFGVALQDNDVVHADLLSGNAIFYGSIVNQGSGDPSFVPGFRTREQSRVTFIGVDRDQNGTVDISAHDNVLDAPVESLTYGFPSYFRVVASGDNSQSVTFEIVSSTVDARLVDDIGTIQMVPSGAMKGTAGQIQLRVTSADGQSTIVTIPLKFE